jgi:hypothetical protein
MLFDLQAEVERSRSKPRAREHIWIAMLGLNPGPANQAVFGDPKGVYFWVAGCATSERSFPPVA